MTTITTKQDRWYRVMQSDMFGDEIYTGQITNDHTGITFKIADSDIAAAMVMVMNDEIKIRRKLMAIHDCVHAGYRDDTISLGMVEKITNIILDDQSA